MKDKDLVYLVAMDVREWAERYQKTSPGRYWDGLGGLCAIASTKLKHDLAQVGVASKFVHNDRHCFLLVEDHIVDVTATQFGSAGHNKITIVHKDNLIAKDAFYWKMDSICDTMYEVQNEMKAWVEHQRPFEPGKEPW